MAVRRAASGGPIGQPSEVVSVENAPVATDDPTGAVATELVPITEGLAGTTNRSTVAAATVSRAFEGTGPGGRTVSGQPLPTTLDLAMQGLRGAETAGQAANGPLVLVVFDDATWRWYMCQEFSDARDGVKIVGYGQRCEHCGGKLWLEVSWGGGGGVLLAWRRGGVSVSVCVSVCVFW